ncbi:reverse transcriptase, partial [Globisporangium splendens]
MENTQRHDEMPSMVPSQDGNRATQPLLRSPRNEQPVQSGEKMQQPKRNHRSHRVGLPPCSSNVATDLGTMEWHRNTVRQIQRPTLHHNQTGAPAIPANGVRLAVDARFIYGRPRARDGNDMVDHYGSHPESPMAQTQRVYLQGNIHQQRGVLNPNLDDDFSTISLQVIAVLCNQRPYEPLPAVPAQSLRIHFDGGSRGNLGIGGSGWRVSDREPAPDQWKLLECGCAYHGLGVTDNFCEVYTLRLGLAAAQTCGNPSATMVEVIGDSRLLIAHLNGEARITNSNLAAEINEITRLARGFNGLHWTHARRKHNKAADLLANFAMNTKSSRRLAGTCFSVGYRLCMHRSVKVRITVE